mmetsp:Transcript_26190/g.78149  ORF Transcript_26190/g.78149 Transcript_26190/m.78149 type:complete len:206 (-) Transcript_26190:280-897(-)
MTARRMPLVAYTNRQADFPCRMCQTHLSLWRPSVRGPCLFNFTNYQRWWSRSMPGPLVEERVMRCTGLPRNRSGRAPSTAARAAIALSARRSAPKETLPSPTITTPWFCARNSTCPALACCTAAATSVTTVPRFGFGISPLGPSTRAALARAGSASGVASTRSKSSRPASTSATSSSAPTRSAPAARAASASAPRAKTATRTVLP